MAIRIDSEGPVDERKVVCPHCRYRIAFTPNDIQENHYTDISGVGDTSYSITCPKCGNHITVSKY